MLACDYDLTLITAHLSYRLTSARWLLSSLQADCIRPGRPLVSQWLPRVAWLLFRFTLSVSEATCRDALDCITCSRRCMPSMERARSTARHQLIPTLTRLADHVDGHKHASMRSLLPWLLFPSRLIVQVDVPCTIARLSGAMCTSRHVARHSLSSSN